MNRLLGLLAMLWFLVIQGSCFASVEELQTAFQKRYDQSIADRDQKEAKLRRNYLAALKGQFEKTKLKGKLELVIPIKDQIDAIEAGENPLPELSKNAPYELGRLRGTFDQGEKKIKKAGALDLVELAEKMEKALTTEKEKLIKAGQVDEALWVQKIMEGLAEDPNLRSARVSVNPDRGDESWLALTDANWKTLQAGNYWVGDAKGEEGAGSGLSAKLVELISKDEDTEYPNFVAVPPARVEFRLKVEATMLRVKVWMASTGDAKVKIFTTGEEAVAELDVAHPDKLEKELELKFEPTKKIVIEFSPNGPVDGDWVVLLSPQYR